MEAEREWGERLRSGDREALGLLMDAYGGEVYRTALLLLRDKHTSEDMAQEVFLTVYRKIGQLSYPYREVVVLHYFHDKSVAVMSDMLGTSEGTIKSHLSRAREHMLLLWKEGEKDDTTG